CLLHILCHGVDMDAEKAIKEFQKRKVVTIEEIADLLDSSVTTARRQLKKWRTYTSFNMNGRYYSLPGIPRFDEHGIWKYREILFSQYGNLMQTISQLIERSETGLNARQIAQLARKASRTFCILLRGKISGAKIGIVQTASCKISDRFGKRDDSCSTCQIPS
ncbi:conserved hypothetical protein, partial [delta proteobacterium NaphS2]